MLSLSNCSERKWFRSALVVRVGVFLLAMSGLHVASAASSRLLAHENLVPWEVQWNQGSIEMRPEARARMLKAKGFRRHAIMYSPEQAENLDDEIAAYQRSGVEITAVYFLLDTELPGDDPNVQAALEAFGRLKIRPTIWISQSSASFPKTIEDWKQRFSELGYEGLQSFEDFRAAFSSSSHFTEEQKERFFRAYHRSHADEVNLPRTTQEQMQRLDREVGRVESLAVLASRHGLNVGLYNHSGWFGLMENQVAIIEKLAQKGVKNVGIMYTFWHARDNLHDDVKVFEQIWAMIRPHVYSIGISGVRGEVESLYPGEGVDELRMMKIIQKSGWHGPVAVLCLDYSADADTVLRSALKGVDWIAAELNQAGSGGAKPAFRKSSKQSPKGAE